MPAVARERSKPRRCADRVNRPRPRIDIAASKPVYGFSGSRARSRLLPTAGLTAAITCGDALDAYALLAPIVLSLAVIVILLALVGTCSSFAVGFYLCLVTIPRLDLLM
jgi:hypothetical protein